MRCPCGSEAFTPATYLLPPHCQSFGHYRGRHGGMRYPDTWRLHIVAQNAVQSLRRPSTALPLAEWDAQRPYRTTKLDVARGDLAPLFLLYEGPYLTVRYARGVRWVTICTLTRFADDLVVCSCGVAIGRGPGQGPSRRNRDHVLSHDHRVERVTVGV